MKKLIEINYNSKEKLNGNLTGEAVTTDTATGKDQSIKIEGSSNLSDDELDRMRKDAELHDKEDQERVDRQTKINAAESAINAAEKQIEEFGEKISDDLKKELQEKIDALKTVFNVSDNDRDMESIETATKALQEVSWKVSAEVYKKENPDASGAQGFDPNMFTQFTGGRPFNPTPNPGD